MKILNRTWLSLILILSISIGSLSCHRDKQFINDACVILNGGMLSSIDYFEKRIDSLLQTVSGSEIESNFRSITGTIEKIKSDLYNLDGTDSHSLKNLYEPFEIDIVQEYLLGEDQKARSIETSLLNYQTFLLSMTEDSIQEHFIKSTLAVVPYNTKKWGEKSWLSWNFELLPMINILANLDMIKLRIYTVQYEMLVSGKLNNI